MAYYLAKFFRYIPVIDGMSHITGVDNFNIINVTTDAALAELQAHPDDIPLIELTEEEATQACKYYMETRGYRSAYSDLEGLEPDPESLAQGKRKTKVPLSDDLKPAVISLLKKAFKMHINEEMNHRKKNKPNLDGSKRPKYHQQKHDELLAMVDTLNTIDDIHKARELVIGIEMTKDLASRLGLWDDTRNTRKEKVKFGVQF
jgi:hypothetical protein